MIVFTVKIKFAICQTETEHLVSKMKSAQCADNVLKLLQ